jgi:HemK-related putative methylase
MKDSNFDLYHPREDSFLLAKYSKLNSYGRVLDMGCGSGIQGIAAIESNNINAVVFADINPQALRYAESELIKFQTDHKLDGNIKTRFILTDLFSELQGKFDTILFNPPYLPNHNKIKDVACDGGPKGHELTVRFLDQVSPHLEIDGKILLLFSSFTGRFRIIESIEKKLMAYKQLDTMKLDHEELYVFEITRSDIAKKLCENNIKDISLLAKGKRGMVIKSGEVCIKVEHPGSKAIARIENEINTLAKVNKYSIGPKLIDYCKKTPYFIMEFITGLPIEEYFRKSSYKQNISIIIKIIQQLYRLDKLRINKLEMTNPYKHIIIRNNEPVLLDFERAKLTLRPKNITQFMDYLYSRRNIIKIPFDQTTMKILTIKYKKTFSNYRQILNYLRMTPFQHRVYARLIKVPKGKVTTYGRIAESLGIKGFRAVGQAMRKNPLAPEVPCHRVIRADKTLGGYAGGPEKKLKMLQDEGVIIQRAKNISNSKVIADF